MVQRLRPAAIVMLAATFMTAWMLWLVLSPAEVRVNVRWRPGLSDAERETLESQFHLANGSPTSGSTFVYVLTDRSVDNIRALVQHPAAEDTDGINRTRFRPFNAFQHETRVGGLAVAAGTLIGLGWLVAPFVRHRARREWVVSPRVVVLTVTLPSLVLVAGSALMFVGGLAGRDPLWLSTSTAATRSPDAPGQQSGDRRTAGQRSRPRSVVPDDTEVRRTARPDPGCDSLAAQVVVVVRSSEGTVPGAAACATWTRAAFTETSAQ